VALLLESLYFSDQVRILHVQFFHQHVGPSQPLQLVVADPHLLLQLLLMAPKNALQLRFLTPVVLSALLQSLLCVKVLLL
jgi:hypothetical protein